MGAHNRDVQTSCLVDSCIHSARGDPIEVINNPQAVAFSFQLGENVSGTVIRHPIRNNNLESTSKRFLCQKRANTGFDVVFFVPTRNDH